MWHGSVAASAECAAQRLKTPEASVAPELAQRLKTPEASVAPELAQRRKMPEASVAPELAERRLAVGCWRGQPGLCVWGSRVAAPVPRRVAV